MTSALTPAQEEALDRARTLLGEHFDFMLLAVAWDATTPEDKGGREAKALYYKGSFMACTGLASWAQWMLLTEPPNTEPKEFES